MSTFFWSSPLENFNNLNKHVVLDFIRYSPIGISRVEYSRQLTPSRGAITAIISEFLTMGLGHEVVVSHPSGTKPILLKINPAPGLRRGGECGCPECHRSGEERSSRRIEPDKPCESVRSREVIAAACSGDLLSQQILSEAGTHLGAALAGLVNLVNPSIVNIGGGVSQIGDLLLEPNRATVIKRCLKMASKHSEFQLPFNAGVFRAWAQSYRRYL